MKLIKIFLLTIFTLGIYTQAAAQRKNILFIVVDDLNTDQAAFGNDAVYTPTIDALSQEGIRFTNMQCSFPVCGASRSSFMTGTYPETNGVTNLSTKLRDVSPKIVTIPQYLKEIGYVTEAIGKIYDGRCIDDDYDYPTSWSTEYVKRYTYPAEYGDFYKGQYRVEYPDTYTVGPSAEKGPEGVLDDGYVDGQIALDAVRRLESYKNSDKPFFLGVGFKKPHLPFISPKKYWNMYNVDDIEIASYQKLPEGTTDIAFYPSTEFKNYDDVRAYTSDGTKNGDFTSSVTIGGQTFDKVLEEQKQKEAIMGYYAAVSYIDAQIKIVVDALEDNGLKDNTLIILTSDHGFALGDHGIWAKHNILNNSSQVPFIIIDPNRVSGVENRAVQLVDVFPTICDWLGIPMLEQMQGNSIFQTPTSTTTFPLDLAVTYYKNQGKKGYSFKRGNYRYTLWTKQTPMTDTYKEMTPFTEEFYKYDTGAPQAYEQKNIIGTSDNKDKLALKEIKEDVEKWWTAYYNNHTNESEIPDLANDYFPLKNRFTLYPNPAEDIVNIIGDFGKNTKIRIHTLAGKLVMNKTVSDLDGSYQLKISSLKKGSYLISVDGINYKIIKE